MQHVRKLSVTPRDIRVYEFIEKYHDKHEYAPTLSEIADELESSRQSVHRTVSRLVKMNCLMRESKQLRGIILIKSPKSII